ncbi:hypothetical protein AAAC51_07355 [Priestia megaterium]
MTNKYLISYIEDNDLGVYVKEILVESNSFQECFQEQIKDHPTIYSIKQLFGELEARWKNYYTHESQDLLQRSKVKTQSDFEDM